MSAIPKLSETKRAPSPEDRARELAGGLFPHQVEGVAFLLGRRRAILADDMGLGKTRQAIVALTHVAPEGPYLVVCPASVKQNWVRELGTVDPQAPAHIVGPDVPPLVGYRGFVMVNYDILSRHVDALLEHRWSGVVFDEAHYIKNHTSNRSRMSVRLVETLSSDAPVYLLTGTPLTNRPRDLFALLNVIRHPMGKSFLSFAKRYCAGYHNGFGWVTDGASNLEELTVQLNGSLLRRNKAEVLNLPPKLRTWLGVEVPAGTGLKEMRDVILELGRSRARQRTGQPGTNRKPEGGADRVRLIAKITKARKKLAAAKVRSTIDLVQGALDQGEKVIVFSCFDAPVKKLYKRFEACSVLLTGATPAKKRQALVDRFQSDPETRLFVANIIAGGTGLNLTAARQVVFNDLDWVPANHWQAEDRAYRIGQTETVNVHYLVAEGTVDCFVKEVLEAKSALVSAVVDGKALEADMNANVLDALSRFIGQLSPRLASAGEKLGERELESLIREAADGYREENQSTPANSGEPAGIRISEAAIQALVSVLNGPKVERYRVVSNSRPGAFYEIELVDGDVLCSCPGFEYRGACTHARKLKSALVAGRDMPAGYEAMSAIN